MTSPANMTQRLAKLCLEELPARIGKQERANARLCMLDSLAVALAAADLEPIRMLWETSAAGSWPAEASVLGGRGKVRTDAAALVNGMMVSLLLYDDNHSEMRGHPSGPLFPAVLAVAELTGASLADAITAFIVGYEVECQLGPVFNPSQYEVGWHATATQGTFAAVTAAGLLLELSEEAMCRALAIAASSLGGARRNFGSMTMSLHSGLAASAGVRAARLAAKGFSADPAIFDGEMSIGAMLNREWRPELLSHSLERWGRPFAIVNSGPIIKLMPTGRPTLSPIECALAVRDQLGAKVTGITRIVCEVSFMYPRTLIHSAPRTGLQGKTSLQYCVASALLDGRPTLATFTDAAVQRQEIAALIACIEAVVPPHLTEADAAVRALPFDQPVTIRVETNDGTTAAHSVTHHKGTAKNPVTLPDVLGKFADCTQGRLPADRGVEIAALLARDDGTVADLMALIGES